MTWLDVEKKLEEEYRSIQEKSFVMMMKAKVVVGDGMRAARSIGVNPCTHSSCSVSHSLLFVRVSVALSCRITTPYFHMCLAFIMSDRLLAVAENRVVLSRLDGDQDSDSTFINASYIDVRTCLFHILCLSGE